MSYPRDVITAAEEKEAGDEATRTARMEGWTGSKYVGSRVASNVRYEASDAKRVTNGCRLRLVCQREECEKDGVRKRWIGTVATSKYSLIHTHNLAYTHRYLKFCVYIWGGEKTKSISGGNGNESGGAAKQ